jgi:hypothetical protein
MPNTPNSSFDERYDQGWLSPCAGLPDPAELAAWEGQETAAGEPVAEPALQDVLQGLQHDVDALRRLAPLRELADAAAALQRAAEASRALTELSVQQVERKEEQVWLSAAGPALEDPPEPDLQEVLQPMRVEEEEEETAGPSAAAAGAAREEQEPASNSRVAAVTAQAEEAASSTATEPAAEPAEPAEPAPAAGQQQEQQQQQQQEQQQQAVVAEVEVVAESDPMWQSMPDLSKFKPPSVFGCAALSQPPA